MFKTLIAAALIATASLASAQEAPSATAAFWTGCSEQLLGAKGAAQCVQAQRNLTARGVAITEDSVQAEMDTTHFDAACLARVHFPQGELVLPKPEEVARCAV